MTKKQATIYDIAEALQISASTVSRALKGNKRININTQEKVIKYATKIGYQANAFAANLRKNETKTIGVIVPRIDSKFISSCLAGAEKVASEKGYSLLISQSLESTEKEKTNALSLFNKRVDGLLVSMVQSACDTKHFNNFTNKGVPVLFFDRAPCSSDYPTVEINNFEAAKVATQHLINQGCKKLVHISLNSTSSVYFDRKKGFESAIKQAKLRAETIEVECLDIENGKKAAHLIDRINTDGIFISNDQAAIGCMSELLKMGVKIPGDIAIVGFNNDPICEIVVPPLSSINYPAFEMGTFMTNQLIEHILGNADINLTQKTLLKSKLIIRESSKRK